MPQEGLFPRLPLGKNRLILRAIAPCSQDLLHASQVVFGVHAHRVEGRFGGMDLHAMIEEAKLFQSLAALQLRLRPQAELLQRPGV